ncbi:hypothetical protein B7Z00_04450 [Candidatus Saccharibacteria bacterium 32-50-10]|nr:MAG: hypothetical protein B7Z00_04450 [Candidatus Saccharibacteria bacterium 32-50-10]
MKQRSIHRAIYRIKHDLLTLNNVIIGLAAIVALGWVWGSLGVMQRNYTLQQTLNRKNQELQLAELETRSLELEQLYFKTEEFQELAVRARLGKGLPGEKVLILPKQVETDASGSPTTSRPSVRTAPPSNFEQWLNFLF